MTLIFMIDRYKWKTLANVQLIISNISAGNDLSIWEAWEDNCVKNVILLSFRFKLGKKGKN